MRGDGELDSFVRVWYAYLLASSVARTLISRRSKQTVEWTRHVNVTACFGSQKEEFNLAVTLI
jgi:hypothetical protein